jgi:hypothetical protein
LKALDWRKHTHTHTHTHELNVFDGNKTYTGILLEDFTNF